jgi:hypothetical protein
VNYELTMSYLKMKYELITNGLQVNYKWVMNILWNFDRNPCEWTPFIMWPCSILMFVTQKYLVFQTSIVALRVVTKLLIWDNRVTTSVVHVNGLGLTLCVNVNPIMKFIYISCKCKCIISIYIHIHVNVKLCKFILCHVK